jgi:hypothetical protein
MKILAGMLAATIFALMAVAQSTPSHLQLLAKVVTSANPAQTEVAVTFLNTSDHTLSFPKPVLFCHELAGSMTVSSTFKPADANSRQNETGIGCAACRVRTSVPDILEETKDWIVLAPGESIEVKDRLARAMVIGDAGTYELRVIYAGPMFDRRDLMKFHEAGINVPLAGKYASDPVTFEIGTPESTAY